VQIVADVVTKIQPLGALAAANVTGESCPGAVEANSGTSVSILRESWTTMFIPVIAVLAWCSGVINRVVFVQRPAIYRVCGGQR
jgi:hypothetical protein